MVEFGRINELPILNPPLSELLARLARGDIELAPAEQVQLRHYCNRLANIFLQGQAAYNNGLLDDATYKTLLDDVEAVLGHYPGLARHFHATLRTYPNAQDLEIVQKAMAVAARVGAAER